MDSKLVEKVLTSDEFTRGTFRGVFPRDIFVETPFSSLCTNHPLNHYIVNLDESDSPGSHWIAVEYDKNTRNVTYFDSYALGPSLSSDIEDKFIKEAKTITYNFTPLQMASAPSSVCGQYCILFCLLRARNFSLAKVSQLLLITPDTTRHQRDHIIDQTVRKHFPSLLQSYTVGVHNVSAFI